jgi:nitrilase
VHIAAWPTVRESYAIASRHYAFEGRCFVLAAGLVQHRDDLLEGLQLAGGDAEAEALIRSISGDQLISGGSLILAPDGRILAEAGAQEQILYAQLNLAEIAESLTALDTDGHYSRPDVFELKVNQATQDGVIWDGA